MSEPLPDVLHDAIAQFSARAATHLRDAVALGSVAEVSAFDHEHDRVGLALDDVSLSGLESLEPTRLDWGGGTQATLTLTTDAVSLRGTYRVASSPVSRPALEMASMLGSQSPDTFAAAATAQSDTQLAAWFRDNELEGSGNGHVLTGMYSLHEDTINKLTTGTTAQSQALRNEMRKQRTKDTTNAVRKSTAEHQVAKLRGQSADAATPIEPTNDASGFGVYTYLFLAAKGAAGASQQDRTNEYAKLLNSMAWTNCAVKWVRSRNPGRLNPQQILRIIADTPQAEIERECGPKPVAMLQAGADPWGDPETARPLWPLDREEFLQAHDARVERRLLRKMAPASGAFADETVRLEIDLDVTLNGTVNGTVAIEALHPRVTLLRIRLAAGDAFAGRESLHSRLDAFAGETAFYIDLLRTRIAAALTTPDMRDRFVLSMNGR
jgi:hypothetical protein